MFIDGIPLNTTHVSALLLCENSSTLRPPRHPVHSSQCTLNLLCGRWYHLKMSVLSLVQGLSVQRFCCVTGLMEGEARTDKKRKRTTEQPTKQKKQKQSAGEEGKISQESLEEAKHVIRDGTCVSTFLFTYRLALCCALCVHL